MLYAELQSVEPLSESIEPTVCVRVQVHYNPQEGPPIGFTARLKLGGKRFVSGVATGVFAGSNVVLSSQLLLHKGAHGAVGDRKVYVEFHFPLSQREIDAIQREREPSPQADIDLTLSIQVEALDSGLTAFPIDFVDKPSGIGGAVDHLVAFHPPQKPGNFGDVLLGRGSEDMLRFVTHALPEVGIRIAASHWVRDYAKAFGIGRFMTVDIPQPDEVGDVTGELAVRVREATDALAKMQEDLRKGEWTQCAEDCRPVLELINRPDLLRPLLKTSGLPEANESALLDGLKGVFDYSHSFHHRVERGGKVTEGAVNANPEDAYLAFTTSAALLNLVSRKLRRSAVGSTTPRKDP